MLSVKADVVICLDGWTSFYKVTIQSCFIGSTLTHRLLCKLSEMLICDLTLLIYKQL